MSVVHLSLILTVMVMSFDGMGVLAANCSERQYLHGEICCQKCRPGYVVEANCTDEMDTQCRQCLPDFYSNDWTADNLCKERNSCNTSHAYIRIHASVNNTDDTVCACEDGWHRDSNNQTTFICTENPLCPPGQGILEGQCIVCESEYYSDSWSRVEPCKPQPRCQDNGLSMLIPGNSSVRSLCINVTDEAVFTNETVNGNHSNLTTRIPAERFYSMKNILNDTDAQERVAMTTTLSSLTLMAIVANKPSEENKINYRLIVVSAIVGGGLLIVVIAFFVSEVRRILRRKKGLLPSSYTRSKNSKGMVVNFADKRKPRTRDNSNCKLNETGTDEINENTPMLVENVNNIDLSVIIWEPIKQYNKRERDEQTRTHDEWTTNNEERVTCV